MENEPGDIKYLGETWEEVSLEEILDSVKKGPKAIQEWCQAMPSRERLLEVGATALWKYVQNNFTGPAREWSEELPKDPVWLEAILSALALDRPLYHGICNPELLLVARSALLLLNTSNPDWLPGIWWKLRYLRVHQMSLPANSLVLRQEGASLCALLDSLMPSIPEDLQPQLQLELALLHITYFRVTPAQELLDKLLKRSNLTINLDGALGTRTVHQRNPKPQLLLTVEKNTADESSISSTEEADQKSIGDLPTDVKFDEGDLLDKLKLVENRPESQLEPWHQALVLAQCLVRQRLAETAEVQREELMSYVDLLLQRPQAWALHSTALLLRSKLDKHRTKRCERALKQLEELSRNFDCEATSDRMQLFFCSHLQPHWMINKEIADLLVYMKRYGDALAILERLQLWDEIIVCHKVMGQRDKAEKTIRQEIEKQGRLPRLLCHLGDVTADPNFYQEAWDNSGKTYIQAQNCLGYHLYLNGRYGDCIPFFLTSLEHNPCQADVWYALGVSADTVDDYHLSSRAFLRYCELDPNKAEAWNNLGKAYIYTKEKRFAWKAIKESLRCSYDDWRIWENYIVLSIDVGAFNDVINAWHRLIDLKKKYMDEEILRVLVRAIVDDIEDMTQNKTSRLRKKMLPLMARITSNVSNPTAWQMYALLYQTGPEKDAKESQLKILHYLKKAHDGLKAQEGWHKEMDIVNKVLDNLDNLGQSAVKFAESFPQDPSVKNELKSVTILLEQATDFLSQNNCRRSPESKEKLSQRLEELKPLVEKLKSLNTV